MNKRLSYLVQKNEARLQRQASLSTFSKRLGSLSKLDPSSLVYASFDETNKVLEESGGIATGFPAGIEWTFSNSPAFSEKIDDLKEVLPNRFSHIILREHFLYLGAIESSLHACLENIGPFFDLGEETILALDRDLENYMRIMRDEDPFTASGIEYSIRILGPSWPSLCR